MLSIISMNRAGLSDGCLSVKVDFEFDNASTLPERVVTVSGMSYIIAKDSTAKNTVTNVNYKYTGSKWVKVTETVEPVTSGTITDNGDYIITNNEYTGLSDISVDVSGGGVEFSASPESFKLLTNIQNLKVDVPSGVTHIGNSAFKGCTGLTEITLPTSICGIGDSAFDGCTGLTEITISSNLPITIDTAAFDHCTGLTEININKVTSISQYAFNSCTGLTEITLPSMINSISITAFAGCTNLETITINKSEGSISGAPWGASNATVVWTG